MMPPESLKLRVLEAVRQRPMPHRTDRLPSTIGLAALAAVAMSASLQWGPRLFGDVGGLAHAVGRPAASGAWILAGNVALALSATWLELPYRRSMLAIARAAPGRRHRRAAAGRRMAGARAHHLRRSLYTQRLALLRTHGPDRPLAVRNPRIRQPPRRAAAPRDGWSGPRCRGRRLGGGDGRAVVPAGGARAHPRRTRPAPPRSHAGGLGHRRPDVPAATGGAYPSRSYSACSSRVR